MTEESAGITVWDICVQILQTAANGKAGRHSKPITDGLTPRRREITEEGLYELTPEEILTIRVERIEDEGERITGYQRHVTVPRIRAIGRAGSRGRKIAPPTLALDPVTGILYATDGQHRLCGAVLGRFSLKVSVEFLGEDERVQRFADQALAVRPGADVLILGRASSDPIAGYIREAIEAEKIEGSEHALAGFVGIGADRKRLGVPTVYDFLSAYTLNVIGPGQTRIIAEMAIEEARRRIPKAALDEATSLLRAFGPKQTAHHLTYAPATVRALRDIAVVGVRRAPDRRAVERWCRLMPKFKWSGIPVEATRSRDVRFRLERYWNRNLPAGYQKVIF